MGWEVIAKLQDYKIVRLRENKCFMEMMKFWKVWE